MAELLIVDQVVVGSSPIIHPAGDFIHEVAFCLPELGVRAQPDQTPTHL